MYTLNIILNKEVKENYLQNQLGLQRVDNEELKKYYGKRVTLIDHERKSTFFLRNIEAIPKQIIIPCQLPYFMELDVETNASKKDLEYAIQIAQKLVQDHGGGFIEPITEKLNYSDVEQIYFLGRSEFYLFK